MLAPPKSCIIKLLMSGSSSFIWLSNRIKECRVLQKQNAQKKSLCAHWCDQGLCDPMKWTLQNWLLVTTYILSGWSLAWSQIGSVNCKIIPLCFSFWHPLYRVLAREVNGSKLSCLWWLKIQFNFYSLEAISRVLKMHFNKRGLLISWLFFSEICHAESWHGTVCVLFTWGQFPSHVSGRTNVDVSFEQGRYSDDTTYSWTASGIGLVSGAQFFL